MATKVEQKTELQKPIYIHSNVKQQDLHRARLPHTHSHIYSHINTRTQMAASYNAKSGLTISNLGFSVLAKNMTCGQEEEGINQPTL